MKDPGDNNLNVYVKEMVLAYFDIVRDSLLDYMPKIISMEVFSRIKTNFNTYLL